MRERRPSSDGPRTPRSRRRRTTRVDATFTHTVSVERVTRTSSTIAACCSRSDDSFNGNCGAGATDEIPTDIVCTGLYTDITTKTIAPTARRYAPAVAFWSDGLEKDRYIQIPDGQTIDDSAPDDWRFPIGTKVWKDIHNGATKLETRFHVNCRITCHNSNPGSIAYTTELHMRLGFDEVSTKPAEQWEVYTTLVNVETTSPGREGTRVVLGKPEESALIEAMGKRGDGQMPPIATKIVDANSVATVRSWIKGLH